MIYVFGDSFSEDTKKETKSSYIDRYFKYKGREVKFYTELLSEKLNQLYVLQNALFPKGNLQERTYNFATFYSEFGPQLIAQLLTELKPLEQKFSIIKF